MVEHSPQVLASEEKATTDFNILSTAYSHIRTSYVTQSWLKLNSDMAQSCLEMNSDSDTKSENKDFFVTF